MATLTELRPNGDILTTSILKVNSGGDTLWYQCIDDDPDSPDSSDYIYNSNDIDATLKVDLTATDADLSNMDTATVAAYFSSNGTRSDDSIVIYIKITNAAETTDYIVETEIARWDSGGAQTGLRTAGSVTAAGIAATKADWDAARLHIRYYEIEELGRDRSSGRRYRIAGDLFGGRRHP